MTDWIERADELLDTMSIQPFRMDIVINTEVVVLRWGIPSALVKTNVSANAEAFAVNLANGTPTIPEDKKYKWIRDKARATDAWNCTLDMGTLIRKLVEAMGGSPTEVRATRFRFKYPGSMYRGIEFHYAVIRGFPEGDTSSLTPLNGTELARQVRLCETECQSLLLECCHDAHIHDVRVDKSSLDLPGGTTTFPHASKRAADETSEERRKRLKKLNKEPTLPKYEPTSPKYDPTLPRYEPTSWRAA